MAYSVPERATLFALMAQGREVTNNALKEVYKIDLKAASRTKLNRDGLVVSRKQGRGYVHELTDKGWAWVKTEFTQAAPPRSGSLVAALYAVLATLGTGLDRRGLTLADLTVDAAGGVPPTKTNGSALALPDQIRTAYRRLAKGSQDWVYLSELRPLISGASKAQVDSALKDMHRERVITLTLEEDQKSLTAAQRSAAVRIGVDDMHLIAME
jgi:hypothetical protein